MNDLEKKAAELFDGVHASEAWRGLLVSFCEKFCTREQSLRTAFVEYMVHSGDHDNRLYEDAEIRYAMMVESEQADSWHAKRRSFLARCLEYPSSSSGVLNVHEYGFGILRPEYVNRGRNRTHKFWLSDAYASAIDVATFMLDREDLDVKECGIELMLESFEATPIAKSQPDLVLLLDSIEHAEKPTASMDSIVHSSKNTTVFGLIIPVGPKIASHYLAWDSIKDVENWLMKFGLTVKHQEIIRPDGDFDLFAMSTNDTFGHAVICERS